MATQVKVIGMEATIRALDEYGKNMDSELKAAVKKTSEEVLDVSKKSMKRRTSGPKHGKRISSLPGKPPNIQSGELYNSMRVDNQGWYADIGTDDFEGRVLEFGTQSMPARPFLLPALERRRFAWFKRLREVAKKAGVKTSRGKRAGRK